MPREAALEMVAWEPPYAAGAAQEMAKKKTKKKNLVAFFVDSL